MRTGGANQPTERHARSGRWHRFTTATSEVLRRSVRCGLKRDKLSTKLQARVAARGIGARSRELEGRILKGCDRGSQGQREQATKKGSEGIRLVG